MTLIVECKLFQIFIQISEDFFRKINVKTRFKMSHFPTTMKHKTLIFLNLTSRPRVENRRRLRFFLAFLFRAYAFSLCNHRCTKTNSFW